MNVMQKCVIALAVSAVAALGCSKKEKDAAGGAETGKTAPKPDTAKPGPDTAKPAPKSKIPVDAELMKAIDAVVAGCDIDEQKMRIECKDGQDKALDELFGYSAPKKTAFTTIATMAVALNDENAKKRTVAADVLGSKHSSGWGNEAKPGSISKDVATELLAAVPKLGKYQGRRSITAVAYAAGLAGETDGLIKTLDASDDSYLKNSGYQASMFYGRMAVFPKIEELAASDDAEVKLAAVSAAANFYKYTDAEKADLCPWAVAQLAADDPGVKESAIFEQAGYVLQRCGGEWIDKLLDFGEKQLKDHDRFDRRYYFVFRGLCFSMMGEKPAANDAQCARNYKFLEKAANHKKLTGQNRAFALDAIPYQRRDKKSMKLMKKYKKSKVPELKKTAEKAIKMLDGYVNKKK